MASRLPGLRDDFRAFIHSGLLELVLRASSDPVRRPFVDGRPESLPMYVRRLDRWAEVADLYFVTDQMTRVAVAAGASLPGYKHHPDDVPSRIGLLAWAEPTAVITSEPTSRPIDAEVAIIAALLGPGIDRHGRAGTHVVTFADAYRWASTVKGEREPDGSISIIDDAGRAAIRASGQLMYHDDETLGYFDDPEVPMNNAALRTLMTTWLLCGQRIATVENAPIERAVRRAYTRAQRPEPVVRNITLRRPLRERTEPADADKPGRVYTHQWVVRGFWRNQWYPSQDRHKPLWIEDYIKGPEGAPLIGADRVNVLRR